MNAYITTCEKCITEQVPYIEQIKSEEVYRGFVIRKHHSPNSFIVCTMPTEGRNTEIFNALRTYIKSQISPVYVGIGDCSCHPHEYVISVNGPSSRMQSKGYQTIRNSIDMLFETLFGDRDEMQNMQQE